MALRAPEADVLREALRSKHDETFERALGRAVRRNGGTYADYLQLISRLRDKASADRVDVRTAAKDLTAHG